MTKNTASDHSRAEPPPPHPPTPPRPNNDGVVKNPFGRIYFIKDISLVSYNI
jgi:hypothetical protein